MAVASSAWPALVSWSVSAISAGAAAWARVATSATAALPSDQVEWQ